MTKYKDIIVTSWWNDVAKTITAWEALGWRTQHVFTRYDYSPATMEFVVRMSKDD